MSEVIRHNCGVVVAHTLHDAYSFINSVKHRGREATGIVAVGENTIDSVKWIGPVKRFEIDDLHKILPGRRYHTFMGHTRYATKGSKDRILEEAHPHVIGGKEIDKGDHVITLGSEAAIVHNGHIENPLIGLTINGRSNENTCDTAGLLRVFRERGEHFILQNIQGAYTAAVADVRRSEVVVFRDPRGMHPGVLGEKDGKHAMASEDVAFLENGGKPIANISPGCAYYFSAQGEVRKTKFVDPIERHCMFEYQYLSHQNSTIDGIAVRRHREMLGEQLAKEIQIKDADLVTFAPRCPEVAARRYSSKTGIPFESVFYKARAERSFQGSTGTDRDNSISKNLHLLPQAIDKIKDKTIIVIDDSIVRGNVLSRVRKLLYDEGQVKKAHMVSFTPPVCITDDQGIDRGCMFGVDMPPQPAEGDQYLARMGNLDEISKAVGMQIHYLSKKGMMNAFARSGMEESKLCTYCLGGSHPFE